jgi:hypothetical protein
MDNYNTIKQYVNAVKPIIEGQRNCTLYTLGLSLRTKFGLTVIELETVLSEVNQMKCTPPLPPSEVKSIAKSVNKPNGDTTIEHNGKVSRKKKKQKQQTEYFITLGAEPVTVATLLAKEVSVYSSCRENIPKATVSIGKALEGFQKGTEKSWGLIKAVRNETDKGKRDELKKKLPALIFGSEPQEQRRAEYCKPNGIICLDFDLYNESITDLESAKQVIAAVPYVFAVMHSVSGQGVCALAAYEGTPSLKILLAAMQADFPYEVDKARSDINGLRYITLDKNLIIKNEVFPAILTERVVATPATESVEPATSSTKSDSLYSPEFCGKMLADLMVDIFGQDEERHIYGFSNYTMRRFVIKNRNHYTLRDLIGDCGTIVDRYVVVDKETDVAGMYTLKQVIDVFVREAEVA